ncbi:hypothetical protein LAG90_15735 [Marinilongibacter aquaticus]|uniref:hypothetical protein n=1 Tax=Marinilongibacter aquaticus TaxID=2975157 RepID=UPI0021BD77B0|nr:hypothetical protein [Marinilongibacter aquaticus]UBM58255.1 hypothetical protein LAG90_15735 [Marinilongibacter aquaticus]
MQIGTTVAAYGALHSGTITATLPKIDDYIQDILTDDVETRWVCLVEDANGIVHIVGDSNLGCTLAVNQVVGTVNESQLVFAGTGIEPFQKFKGSIMDVLQQRTTVDIRRYANVDFLAVASDYISEDFVFYDDTGNAQDLSDSYFILKMLDQTGKVLFEFNSDQTKDLRNPAAIISDSSFSLVDANKTLRFEPNMANRFDPYTLKYVFTRVRDSALPETLMKGYWNFE